MDRKEHVLKNRLADIRAIDFDDHVSNITASLKIVLTLYNSDDDPQIIQACKEKLLEGVAALHGIAARATKEANNFDVNKEA